MSQGAVVGVRAHGRVRGRAARARVLGIAVAVAAVAVLTGCTADPPPQVIQSDYTQPPASTPSPSATGIVAPVRPPELELTDEAGAVAAAEYFMGVYDYATQTGDVTEWTAISGTTCDFCSNLASAVTDVYAGGDRLAGGSSSLERVRVVEYDEQLVAYTVEIDYEMADSQRIDASGAVLEEYSGETGVLDLLLGPSIRGWVLIEGQYRETSRP